MKNLLFILLSSGLLCLSCNEEAKEFQISKNAPFNFRIQTDTLNVIDGTKHLDFEVEGGLENYKKYAESYTFNKVSYEFTIFENHFSNSGKITGYLISDPELMIFAMNDFDYSANSNGLLQLEDGALEALNNAINGNGNFIDIRMVWEVDETPAHFDFSLIFDTTVDANLDI